MYDASSPYVASGQAARDAAAAAELEAEKARHLAKGRRLIPQNNPNDERVYAQRPELINNTEYCHKCGKMTMEEDFREGNYVCKNCGFVSHDKVVDTHSEWRTFSNDDEREDPNRIGAASNPLLNGSDLTTTITGGYGSDAKVLNRAHNKISNNAIDRQLKKAYAEINRICDKLQLNKVFCDRAKLHFKRLEEHYTQKRGESEAHFGAIVGGLKIEEAAAACVYIACREENSSRSFKEIRSATVVREKKITRALLKIVKVLDIHLNVLEPEQYAARFCNNLDLDIKVEKLAKHIAERANELGITHSRVPTTVIATAIYMASQLTMTKRKTMKEVSEVSGVAESTIRDTYKDMYPSRENLIPADSEFAVNLASLI